MAHEIETAMFVRRPAWHGEGTVLQAPPTVEEALTASGLDWKVDKRPLRTMGPDGEVVEVPSHVAMVRDSDEKVLGVVGSKYQPLQNEKAFAFFNPFLHEGDATIEAAGSLRGGKRVWVLARIAEAEADVVKGDPVNGYLLLYNSHDGSLAVGVQFTPIRVVCSNTLGAAIASAESATEKHASVRIRHTRGLPEALKTVQRTIDLAQKTFALSVEQYREIARKRLPIQGLERYVRDVFSVDEDGKMPRAWETIERLYETGDGSDIGGASGTYWGAYNAVTNWISHERGRATGRRTDANWFGKKTGALRTRALAVALDA